LAGEHGLPEFHLVHAVVDHHFDVAHLDDLTPKVGKERKGQVTMHDGLAERPFFCFVFVNVDPLVIERGVSKQVDTLLWHFKPVRGA